MKKILFLTNKGYFTKKIEEQKIDVIWAFRNIWSVFKIFRIAHFNSKLNFKHIWFIKFADLNSYDIIIVSANEFSVYLIPYITKKLNNNSTRLIFWYWNPVKPAYNPNLVSKEWEKWTFDKDDSVKYNLHYNGTYYFPPEIIKSSTLTNDIFFIGLDKNRYKELAELKNIFDTFGLKSDFHIVGNKKIFGQSKKKYKAAIPYEEVIEKISCSKAILEVMQSGQTGLTLRTMESLSYGKKLITTNQSIKDYNFYKKENIFILGIDNMQGLYSFINTPYLKLPSEIVEQYNFENWKSRLLNNLTLDDDFKENICK
ncbi:hypothetical protein ACFSX9_00725 [Flavobacterium ardleyense]|uniref:Glycosyltransferase n=1 Tax=Flavobacterium ardleyense TaxID=2038737 RepID=A0ABW5Z5X4_9FLAO